MKIVKRFCILILVIGIYVPVYSQTVLSSGIFEFSLPCQGGSISRCGVAYNPNQQLYYSVNAGVLNRPIETFDQNGVQVATSDQNFDFRGLWWNSNTSVLEGNGFSSTGIRAQDLNANFYALETGTVSLVGTIAPNEQCSGDYDPVSNEIVYYLNGEIHRYNRQTNTSNSNLTITDLPVAFSNLNSHSIAYTGVEGKEYGVYDYVNKAFYLIDKSNGAYVMTCQLPSTAPSADQFQMAFANGKLWLYDETNSEWKGYKVVELCNTSSSISVSSCNSYTVPSGDETYNSSGNYVDTISNSNGCDSIISINLTINETGDLSTTANDATISATNTNADSYQWIDCSDNSEIAGETNSSYTATTSGEYAVIITNNNCSDTSDCIAITIANIESSIEDGSELFEVYPNPNNGTFTISSSEIGSQVQVVTLDGKVLRTFVINANKKEITLDIEAGIYLLKFSNGNKQHLKRVVVK